MPGYRGHLIGGSVAFVVIHNVLSSFAPEMVTGANDMLIGALLCLLGALFPDIDIKSVGQRVFYSFALLLSMLAILSHHYSLLAVLAVLGLFPLVVPHRGVIHRLWFVVLVPFSVPLILAYGNAELFAPSFILYLYFLAGAVSHLMLDYGIVRFFRR
jgi:hypothetical protein